MNTKTTKQFVDENGIVPLKADKSLDEDAVDQLLEQLGNSSGAIPFYAIFPAGQPNKPILMEGLLTQERILDALKKAGPSRLARADPPPARRG